MRLRKIPGAREAILHSPYVVQEPESMRGRWKEAFPAKGPIHVEVGMGKGRFLTDLAKKNPRVNYLGVEMYDSVLLRALQRLEALEERPENLRFLCVDARRLPEIFGFGEAEKIYLNFSDPWPKARHAKRRLTSREFLKRYGQILPAGCALEFKTDNRDLFVFSLEEIEASPEFSLAYHTFDLHRDPALNAGNVMTEYEEKFASLGNPICKLAAVRNEEEGAYLN